MRKLTTTIIIGVFACNVLHAQGMKGYWFLAEGINYYYINNAIPGSGAAFYSASGGGRLLEQQKIEMNGTLLYEAPKEVSAAFVLNNNAAEGKSGSGMVAHFQKKEFEIRDIQAGKQRENNVVNWKAAIDEPETYDMIVLKSEDGASFKEVAILQPYSPDLAPYSWMDRSPSALAYYKVAVRGRENDVSYLSRSMNANAPVATAYPTTVTNFINVDISSAEGKNTYKIHDLKGKVLQKGNLTGQQNTIRVNDLAKGVYLLSVYTAHGNITQKIIRK